MDLEDEGEGRRHGGRILCGSGGNKKGGMRKMTAGEWAYIQLSHATAHGATQSRQSMWRASALPRHRPHRAYANVAAWSRQNMWRDPSASHATELGATKRASFRKFRSVRVIYKILD